jgi:REP element-mobilizing transposase RayT
MSQTKPCQPHYHFADTAFWQRTPWLRRTQPAELMMGVLAHYREQKKYVLHEFVIMPNHLHLLLTPAQDFAFQSPRRHDREIQSLGAEAPL